MLTTQPVSLALLIIIITLVKLNELTCLEEEIVMKDTYCVVGNFGEVFNMENWQIF